jgi:hypothetical protein
LAAGDGRGDRPVAPTHFVTFVLFVVINFLTTKDTKHTKEEAQRKKAYRLTVNYPD